MSSSTFEHDPLRCYLLGKLTGEERAKFEQRLFIDDELSEELLATEHELIDDYLIGDLSQHETQMFEENFLVTDERRENLSLGKALREYAEANPNQQPALHSQETSRDFIFKTPQASPLPFGRWRPLFSQPLVKSIAFAAVLLIAALGIWRIFFYHSDVDRALVALNNAYREQRPIEARLSGFTYAPYLKTGGDLDQVNSLELDNAENYLRDALRDEPGADSYHVLGKLYLARKSFDLAIRQFEQALNSDPNKAQIYADLGAALFEKGKLEIEKAKTDGSLPISGKGIAYLADSLRNLNKALQLNNNLLEVLFNRALLYESMALLPQAEEDWWKYFEKDSNSKWASEAQLKLRLIEQTRERVSRSDQQIHEEFLRDYESGDEDRLWKLVSGQQNRTGNVVVEHLIDIVLDHAAKNQKDETDRTLQMLAYVGDLQVRKSADRFFYDLARFYESATYEQQKAAAAARELMKKGYGAWGKLKVEENLSLFRDAEKLFEKAGDFPEARVAEYWISFCHFRQHDQKTSRQILDQLLLLCESKDYAWLQVRSLYLLSAVQFDLNEHSKAVDFGLRAFQMAERTNDSVGIHHAANVLIEYYRYLGNYPKSLGYIQRCLPLVTSTPLDPIQSARHYSLAALAFATIGLNDTAAAYQREALRFALSTGSKTVQSQNYAFLGMINGKLKNFSEAFKNVQLALDLAKTDSSEGADRSWEAYAALQMGNIHREAKEFDKASDYYTRSIELYETFPNFKTHLYQAHKGRLLCYLRQQNDPLTGKEISITLDLMEKYRSKISDENNRNTFFDVEQSVFDAAIDFEYSRMKNPKQAFDYANSSRARSLLDLLNADKEVRAKVQDPDIKFQTVSEFITLDKIIQQLPEAAQILQYAVLEDKVLIWVVSKNGFYAKEKQIKHKELNEKLLRYLNIISQPPNVDGAEESLLAKELYGILIEPVESLLDKDKLVCIISDRTLNYLPFAALISPKSGKYLLEDYLLITSQSPSVFLRCSEKAAKRAGARDERVLSVGNPSFDQKVFPRLDDLPEAAKEARDIRSLYKSGPVLVNDQATRTAIKSEIERSDVIHLALHSQIDDEVPLRSKLLLANSKTNAGDKLSESVLYAYEIYNLKLPRTRLVVLSACQSGAERYYGGEGMTSLARAFIGAGVPLVVASLWPVDSIATEELMVRLHEHRKSGAVATMEALRRAQQEMMRDSIKRFSRPYYWAAFTITGGYAEF